MTSSPQLSPRNPAPRLDEDGTSVPHADQRTMYPSSERSPLLGADSDPEPNTSGAKPATVLGQMTAMRVTALAFSLWLLIFLQASNTSGITMMQGSIAEDLDAYEGTMWFTSGYLITMSSLAPLVGKLATIFSPRSLVPFVGLLIGAGCCISASATSFASFVLGRVVMGFGGAGVLTLAMILILDLTDKSTRGFILGFVNACFSIGVSLGGVVYGALIPVVGWRIMFWAQAPLAIVSTTGVFLSLPRPIPSSPNTFGEPLSVWQKLRRIDYLGSVLLIFTIVSFLYGLTSGASAIWLWSSLCCLGLFVTVESWVASDPVVPLPVLKSRSVLLSCVSQLGLMGARWTVLYYMPIFVLAVRGEPRASAGAILIPTNVGFGLGGIVVGGLHIRRAGSFWLPSVVSIASFVAFMWLLSVIAHPYIGLVPLILSVAAGGFATGAALNYTLAHVLHHSHRGTDYITISLLGTFRGFGGAFGTTIGGSIFARILQSRLIDGFRLLDGDLDGKPLSPTRKILISRLMGAPELVHGGGLTPEDSGVAVDAYASASRGVWQAAAALGLIVLFMQAGTGWNGPKRDEDNDQEDGYITDEEEARALILEHEGAGEA
ncbi:Major Facilitator Superfamily [Geosmithia morbida]|uniref:Major Facilitator Superfamily n=1 Tax=Geosmithia morbida TaxID=1094350 RepID=A0A9P4YQQ6_9HYPO|nr:Major Facilitator Superfamily [Geosmithia morbida]KAF4121020.1 Major Facilitator Superfamily [Geosmithia morbida]